MDFPIKMGRVPVVPLNQSIEWFNHQKLGYEIMRTKKNLGDQTMIQEKIGIENTKYEGVPYGSIPDLAGFESRV